MSPTGFVLIVALPFMIALVFGTIHAHFCLQAFRENNGRYPWQKRRHRVLCVNCRWFLPDKDGGTDIHLDRCTHPLHMEQSGDYVRGIKMRPVSCRRFNSKGWCRKYQVKSFVDVAAEREIKNA